MKGNRAKSLLILVVLLTVVSAQMEQYGTEICRLFADGVKLRSPGTCQDYVTCQNGQSIVTACASNKVYDKEKASCESKTTDSYCSDPCTSKSPTWVADPKSCSGYYQCVSGKGTLGTCSDLHFDQSAQSCVYLEDSTCEGYAYCDIVPNNVPFKNESSCNTYLMCVKTKLTEFICESGYYHPQMGCIKKSEVECDEHPVTIGTCGTAKKPIRYQFVSDERTCRGYYYCDDKGDNTPDPSPRWAQCPANTFFDPAQQACTAPADVSCEDDRCDGRNRAKVISGTPGCQHYLLCDGDVTVSEEQCDSGMYFNDNAMTCTSEVQKYSACL